MSTKHQNETAQKSQTLRRTKEVSNTCVICDTNFVTVRKSRCCSERCRQILRSNKKHTGTEGYDYITCPVCDQRVKQITSKHALSHDYNDAKHMAAKLNMPMITCEKLKEQSQGKNNPGYQHNGKFSKFSKNFIHGYDTDWIKQRAKKHSEFRNNNKELFKTNIEYWQALYPEDSNKAKSEYKKFQTRDLDYFVNKYGETEGKKRHQQKIERWAKSMPKFNYSMVSQELFDQIKNEYNNTSSNIYYATNDREDMKHYENKEYRLKTASSYVMPDFVDLSNKKIIEFDGDYWHSKAKVNPEREKRRHDQILAAGFDVMYVREQNYKKNKQKVIAECLEFLTE